jgi:hypothetical protein
MEEFNCALDNGIIEVVRKHIHILHPNNPNLLGVTMKEYDCKLCSPDIPCANAFSKGKCLYLWTRNIANIQVYYMDSFRCVLYNIAIVRENLPTFFRLLALINKVDFYDEGYPAFITAAIQIAKTFPHMSVWDIGFAYRSAVWKNADFMLESYNEGIMTRRLQKWKEIVYQQQTSGLWEEWEMRVPEFTSWIQWLPRELIEDVATLQGKLCFP